MAALRSTGLRSRSSVAAAGCRKARRGSGPASALCPHRPRSASTRSVTVRSSADIQPGESTVGTPRSAGTGGGCITARRRATMPRGHRPRRIPRRPERRKSDTRRVWYVATSLLNGRLDQSDGVRQSRRPAGQKLRRARPPTARSFDSRGIGPSSPRRPRPSADAAPARAHGDHNGRRSWPAMTTMPRPAATAGQAAIAARRWLRLDAGKRRRT